MTNKQQPTLISNTILTDVNLLLGIDIFQDRCTEEYFLPVAPSPWEVAYLLIRLATYLEALVFFEKVSFIQNDVSLRHIPDHLSPFVNKNPLLPVTDEELKRVSFDERFWRLT